MGYAYILVTDLKNNRLQNAEHGYMNISPLHLAYRPSTVTECKQPRFHKDTLFNRNKSAPLKNPDILRRQYDDKHSCHFYP